MTSRPAIDPAISTLPVMNQLIAKVSSVPMVRQLTALRTDLVCVSAPRNEPTTRDPPCLTTPEPTPPAPSACPPHVSHSTTKHIYGSTTDKIAQNGKVPNGNGSRLSAFHSKKSDKLFD